MKQRLSHAAVRIVCTTLVTATLFQAVPNTLLAHELPGHPGSPHDVALIIDRGLELREKGEDEAALHEFRHAFAISRSAQALAQIALAEQALGRWQEAETHMSEVLIAGNDPWIKDRQVLLERALQDMRDHLATLHLNGTPAGAEVRINGQKAGNLPLQGALRVPVGTVAIEVRAAGMLTVTRSLTATARGIYREDVNLGLDATIPRVQPAATSTNATDALVATVPESGPTPWQKKLAVASVAGAAASFGVGLGFALHRSSVVDDFNANCTELTPSCANKRDSAGAARTGMIVGYVGAGALVTAAVVLWFSAPTQTQLAIACAPGTSASSLFTCVHNF